MHNRVVLLFVLLLSFVAQAALADELTPAKSSDIKRLMEMTGTAGIAKQFAAASSKGIFQTLRAAKTDIPEGALVILETELLALFSEKMSAPGGLIDQVIPIYHKYFTHQDIRELLAFYQTPIGKKTIQVLPKVVNESMTAGQTWGQSLGPEIKTRVTAALKREGIVLEDK